MKNSKMDMVKFKEAIYFSNELFALKIISYSELAKFLHALYVNNKSLGNQYMDERRAHLEGTMSNRGCDDAN